MELAPLLCVVRATERSLPFLIGGLLVVIPVISAVFVVFFEGPLLQDLGSQARASNASMHVSPPRS
jgi:hypothetical protein